MSAICGIFEFYRGVDNSPNLQSMLSALAPFGLDGSGIWKDSHIVLGQQITFNTPESTREKLPFWHSEASIALVADARIDNRDDLSSSLKLFNTPDVSDTRFILAAWFRWGENCVDYLEGDYVFVIWDQSNHHLFCAVDPLGQRNLYYLQTRNRFIFSSYPIGLLASKYVPFELDDNHFIRFHLTPLHCISGENTTCIRNVYRLLGGRTLSVRNRKQWIRHYWKAEFETEHDIRTDEELREGFKEVFYKAIQSRLRTLWPIGALLSGGLDSSSIVSYSAPILASEGRVLHTFSAISAPWDEEISDEREFIDLFRNVDNIDMHLVNDAWRGPFDRDDLLFIARTGDCARTNTSHFLYSAFFQRCQEMGIRTLLEGIGGEMGATQYGEEIFIELFLRGRWHTLINEILHKSHVENLSSMRIISRYLVRPFTPVSLQQFIRFRGSSPPRQNPFLEEYIHAHLNSHEQKQLFSYKNNLLRLSKDAIRFNQQKSIACIQNAKKNLYSRYYGVQTAYPFLDRRVLKFTMAVPSHFKHRHGYKRYIARTGLQGILPEKIQWRTTKMPFCPDYHLRFNSQHNRFITDLAKFSENVEIAKRIDIGYLKQISERPLINSSDNLETKMITRTIIPTSSQMLYFLNEILPVG